MIKKKKIGIVIIVIVVFNVILLTYLFFNPICINNFDCNPDWQPYDYYGNGKADSLIEQCALYSVDNTIYNQFCNGKFRYIYNAALDEYDDENYNIVRHAGAMYSTMDAYKEFKDERYLTGGLKALNYLCDLTTEIDTDIWAVKYDGYMKVGTTAIGILGIVRYWEATGNDDYNNYAENWANFIVSQQRADGAFAGTYGSEEEQLYFSGEALFALALAYDMLEKPEYVITMDKALDFYWNESYNYNNTAFIPWASSGCARWYELTNDIEWLYFCFNMTDTQILHQHLTNDKDTLGNNLYGYLKNPTVNTGVYLEGIGDALRIAKLIGDTQRIEKYHDCLKAGIEWVTSLQFRDISQLRCPNRGFGGFHRAFTLKNAYDIRIDYNQHAISAILRVLREFTDEDINSIEIREGIVDFISEKPLSSWLIVWLFLIIITIVIISFILIIKIVIKIGDRTITREKESQKT